MLSELDENRQKDLIDHIDDIQTILTCTGIEDLILKQIHKGFVYYVEDGHIYPKDSKIL